MLLKIFKKDISRNYIVLLILFSFMMLSVILISSGTFMIQELFTSVDSFFNKAEIPHVVQMHAGAVDSRALSVFAKENELVENYQLSKMISINNQEILFNNEKLTTQAMDISFVKQNQSFDYLLNTKNELERVKAGYIAVPLYFKDRMALKENDKITLKNGTFNKEYIIQYFLRDAQMNAPIISSKRFLINSSDFESLDESMANKEYLIEFLLTDPEKIEVFKKTYSDAALPNKGPMVDHTLFKIMNALSDGIIAVVIIFVSLLLMMIALLCIRFSIITSLEEDFESIGVMKAIGFQYNAIKKIYHFKYIMITLLATFTGYFLSFIIGPKLTKNIALYMGREAIGIKAYIFPLIGSLIIMSLMIFFCGRIINRFKKISPIDTLQMSKTNEKNSIKFLKDIGLKSFGKLPMNVEIALKDVLIRSKMYFLLLIILVICLLIVIIPYNFLTTMSDSSFTSYMGIGDSDIRIDIQNNDNASFKYKNTMEGLKEDPTIKKASGYVTSQYEVLNAEGYYESINIEVGDFIDFPIKLLKGKMPVNSNEIALSKLNADSLGVAVNDSIQLMIKGEAESIIVTGIYQDITNGGKTAKGMLDIRKEHIMWQTISIDLVEGTDLEEKVKDLRQEFSGIKVTSIEGYIEETFAETIKQVKMVTNFSRVVASILLILIISLFTKMIITKDHYEISILRSIGLSQGDIIKQYMLRIIIVSLIAIVMATVIGNTLGASLISLLMSFLGASKIYFIINPLIVYLIVPIAFIIIVCGVTFIVSQNVRKVDLNRVFK